MRGKNKKTSGRVEFRNFVVKNDFNVASTHEDKRRKDSGRRPKHKKDYRFEC